MPIGYAHTRQFARDVRKGGTGVGFPRADGRQVGPVSLHVLPAADLYMTERSAAQIPSRGENYFTSWPCVLKNRINKWTASLGLEVLFAKFAIDSTHLGFKL